MITDVKGFGLELHGHGWEHYGRRLAGDFDCGGNGLGPGRKPGPGRRAQYDVHGGQHAPAISIGSPSVAYTAGGPVTYTVTYADANFNSSNLTAANISLIAGGTAGGMITDVKGSGLSYTVTVGNITGDGSLGILIAAGTASDLAGNLAPAQSSGTFTVDNTGPTVVTSASANPNPISDPTTSLSVLGADLATGEGSLTYRWAATTLPSGAAAPVFGANNGSNPGKNTTADFNSAGTYVLTVTITDPFGLTATSSVNVIVNQTLTSISNSGQPPVITALDQFGNPMAIDTDSDTVTGPLTLDGNFTVLPAAGSQLTISGEITGTGGLTVNAPGTVVLSGTNDYTGGTTVAAGTLVSNSSSAIAAGTSLTVGAGGVFVFDPSFSGGPVTAAITATPMLASSADTVTATSIVTSVTLAAPLTARVILPSMLSSSPTVAKIAGNSPFGQNLQSPNVLPAVLPVRKPVAVGILEARVVDRLVRLPMTRPKAADFAWLGQAATSSDDFDQQHKKETAIQALETVFARYGQ